MEWSLILLLGGILCAIVPFVYKASTKAGLSLSALYALGIFIWGLNKWDLVSLNNVPEHFIVNWIPFLNIHWSFLFDGLSFFFILLISGIGFFIFLYSQGYFGKHPMGGRYCLTLLLFMISMLGLVSSSDMILMFVFWELTGITSFILIGYHFKNLHIRNQAKKALFVTGFGDMFLLLAIFLIYRVSGTFDLYEMLKGGFTLSKHSNYHLILFCFLVGAFTKSAQFPFHFWLPRAMVAPTPISAFLHSATMVKAGVYVIYRFSPILGGSPEWFYWVGGIGMLTSLIGVCLSLFQTDLKSLLAYTTISSLGMMIFLGGVGTKLSILAGLCYIHAHALFKSSLFMVVGSIDHLTGSRDIRKLHNLKKTFPLISIAALISALSMAGLPPLMGYIAKHAIYEANLEVLDRSMIFFAFGILSSVLMVVVSIKFLGPFFFNKAPETGSHLKFHKSITTLWFPPLFLAILTLVLGVGPGWMAQKFLSPVLFSITGKTISEPFHLWHGFNLLFFLGGATYLLGFLFYFFRKVIPKNIRNIDTENLIGPENLYEKIMEGIKRFSFFQTKIIQGGEFWNYLVIVVATCSMVVWYWFFKTPLKITINPEEIHALDLAVIILIIVSALLALFLKSRLGSILAASGVGLGITFIYCLYSAPDLAMTQILVETLTLVLLALVVRKLPLYRPHLSKSRKIVSYVVSGFLSLILSFITLEALSSNIQPSISSFFAQNSYLKAHGRNIVNVILVDFRALDTLGEITVLGLAGLGVYSLTRTHNKNGKEKI